MDSLEKRIAEWFASSDTGLSSKAIALWLWQKKKDERWGPATPSDVGDLARCLRLLEIIPEWKQRIPEMADAGGLWPTFVKHWDEIVEAFMAECGGTIPAQYGEWPDCSKTYELMQAANDAAYRSDNPGFSEVKFDSGTLAGCTVRLEKDSEFSAAFRKAASKNT